MKNKKIILFSAALFFICAVVYGRTVDEGKAIFTSRCAACHNVNKVMTGPALAGIDQRRDIDWIIKFVHSSQTVVKSGDSYAVALFEKFNKIQMPDHPDLTAEQIKSVVEYIKSESKTGGDSKPPFSKPGKKHPSYLPLSIHDYGFFAGYLAVVIMLIVALLFAVQLKTFQRNRRGDK
ncbi:MAG TPA: cytochrome c [Sediminibacterium sp.]|jgi:cytochrome c551/c552|nr:cytochrome c [Chitinophagaceae bacterium]HVZ26789.1 cytochrome c [Sediminibacterium sp.]